MIDTEAIILRTVKYRESSVIFDAFTEEQGLISFIIGGVRKARSRTSAGMLQIGNIVQIIAYPQKGDSLSRVKELHMSQIYRCVTQDMQRIAVLSFAIELLRKSIRETEYDPETYSYIRKFLLQLDDPSSSPAHMPNQLMLELADHVGISPSMDADLAYFDLREGRSVALEPLHHEVVTGEPLALMISLLRRDPISTSLATRNRLTDLLIRYFQYHIDGFTELKSLEVLRSL